MHLCSERTIEMFSSERFSSPCKYVPGGRLRLLFRTEGSCTAKCTVLIFFKPEIFGTFQSHTRSAAFSGAGCIASALACTPFKTRTTATESGQDWQLLGEKQAKEANEGRTPVCSPAVSAACSMFSFVVASGCVSHGPHPSFVLCLTYLFLSNLGHTHTHTHRSRNVTRLFRLWNVQLFVLQQPRE